MKFLTCFETCGNNMKKYNNQLVPAFMRCVLVNNLPDLLDEWHEHKNEKRKKLIRISASQC